MRNALHQVSRRIGSALLGLVVACGPEPVELVVELETDGAARRVSALSFEDEFGATHLYADFPGPAGRAVLEIVPELGAPGSSREHLVEYQEVSNGRIEFDGTILSQSVLLVALGSSVDLVGTFSFVAEDGQARREVRGSIDAPAQSDAARVDGHVRIAVPPPDPCPHGCVLVPAPSPSPEDSGCEGDSASDTGCEGDTTSDSGCEGDTASDSGCEGDTASDSGCEGGSDSGCEGADSCDAMPRAATRSARSLFRLSWPLILVGIFNRVLARSLSRAQARTGHTRAQTS
ncbi:MAG: hypothetical protein HYV07_27965 [Deltaproteobacteria bacterium]|nr:hypothetical protein [Deltaproteobacteria bacterium]